MLRFAAIHGARHPAPDIIVNGCPQDAYSAMGAASLSARESILRMRSNVQSKTNIAPDVIIGAAFLAPCQNAATRAQKLGARAVVTSG